MQHKTRKLDKGTNQKHQRQWYTPKEQLLVYEICRQRDLGIASSIVVKRTMYEKQLATPSILAVKLVFDFAEDGSSLLLLVISCGSNALATGGTLG
jgi:hypothetical protein